MPRARARLDPAALTRAFAPDGLHGATSTDVARAAGVAKPTVYAHTGSKDGAFLACVTAEVEALLSDLAAADLETRTAGAAERLTRLAGAIIEHGRSRPEAARLLHLTVHHRHSSVSGAVEAALGRIPARLAEILRRSTTAGCAELIAPALLGAAAALALDPRPEADQAARTVGAALASVLEPADEATDARVQQVGLY